MHLYTVWRKTRHSGLNEKCLMDENGDYIGQETGTLYPATAHYHSRQLSAIIVGADEENNTGMIHLDGKGDELNKRTWKSRYVGCRVTVEAAHHYGDLLVYRCLELEDYFSERELKLE